MLWALGHGYLVLWLRIVISVCRSLGRRVRLSMCLSLCMRVRLSLSIGRAANTETKTEPCTQA